MASPSSEVDAVGADLLSDRDRVLAFPFTRMSTPDHQRTGSGESASGPGERADQRRHLFDPDEPANEDQNGGVVIGAEHSIEVALGVGQRAWRTRFRPTSRVLDQDTSKRCSTRSRGSGPRLEPVEIHPVRNDRDPIRLDTQSGDRSFPLLGRHRDQMIRRLRLPLQPRCPELPVTPKRPSRCAQHLELARIEVASGGIGRSLCRWHRRQRLPQLRRQRPAVRDRLEQIQFRAVKMGDNRHLRPMPASSFELRGQVVKMEHVGPISAGCPQWSLPHRGQVRDQLRRHRRQDNVGGPGTILVARMHGLWRRDGVTPALEDPNGIGVVNSVNVQTLKERRRVCLLTPFAQRSSDEGDRPAGSCKRWAQIAHDIRRSSPREEQQPHHHSTSSHHHRPAPHPIQRPAPGQHSPRHDMSLILTTSGQLRQRPTSLGSNKLEHILMIRRARGR